MPTTAKTIRAIDRLRKAANLEPTKKKVTLSDGTTFEMWVAPLTLAEKERAQRLAKSDDANEFALRLLLTKAQDENGEKHMDTFEGLMCRVFQHELDHMDGIDFMSRAKKMDLNIAKRKLKRGKLKLKRAHGKDMLARAS